VPRLLITWLTNCIGLLIASAIVSPIGYGHKLGTLLLAGLVLGIVNFAVRPLVILLTLPAVILSFGIALLFINALMLWLTSKIVSGFHIGGFWSTVAGALILWLVNMALRPWTSHPWRRGGRSGDDDAQERWQIRTGRRGGH
jgi:putative membrane protein